jgi:hypothetical protein
MNLLITVMQLILLLLQSMEEYSEEETGTIKLAPRTTILIPNARAFFLLLIPS